MTRVPQRAAAPLTPGCSWRKGEEVGQAGGGGMERWTRLVAWTVEGREGMGKRGERASEVEDLAGETWGRRACLRWREEGGRTRDCESPICDRWCGPFARAVAYAGAQGKGSGGVVGPAWQWAAGEGVTRAPVGGPVACTFCLVGSFGFGPFCSLITRHSSSSAWGSGWALAASCAILYIKSFIFLH